MPGFIRLFKRFSYLLLFVQIFSFNASLADYVDRNCINKVTDKQINEIPTLRAIVERYHMRHELGEYNTCDTPSDEVKIVYTDFDSSGAYIPQQISLKDQETIYVSNNPGIAFKALVINADLCVQTLTPQGWITLGCKIHKKPPPFAKDPNCFVANSVCSNPNLLGAQSPLPITSMIVECVRETITKSFYKTCMRCADGTQIINKFPLFQTSVSKLVRYALILYVILFGIKLAVGEGSVKPGDALKFILKIILVIYFAVGFNNETIYDCTMQKTDGLTTEVMPAFLNLTNSLANLMMKAANTKTGLCDYQETDYINSIRDLSVWDSLDCRIAMYLAMSLGSNSTLKFTSNVFVVILAAGFQLVFLILILVFITYIISITIYLVHTYVLALIAGAIVIGLGPIFIPMVLFEHTKNSFNGWLSLLIGYSLHPAIIIVFMGLMMGVVDNIYYGDCEFERFIVSKEVREKLNITTPKIYYKFKASSIENKDCRSSLGYQLAGIHTTLATQEGDAFSHFKADDNSIADLMPELLKVIICLMLFYYFAEVLTEFIADLTGTFSLRDQLTKPNEFIKAVGEVVGKALDAALGVGPLRKKLQSPGTDIRSRHKADRSSVDIISRGDKDISGVQAFTTKGEDDGVNVSKVSKAISGVTANDTVGQKIDGVTANDTVGQKIDGVNVSVTENPESDTADTASRSGASTKDSENYSSAKEESKKVEDNNKGE